MKVKQMAIWNCKSSTPGMIGYYGAMVLMYILVGVIVVTTGTDGSFNGVSTSATAFMFVLGIVLFSMSLRFGLANGVSRRSVFLGFVASMVVNSALMAILNLLFTGLTSLVFENNMDLAIQLFNRYWMHGNTALSILGMFVVMVCTGICSSLMGYFIGGAYYRMGRITKIAVSIGVPALFVFGLPYLLVGTPAGVRQAIGGFFSAIGSFMGASPYHFSASMLLLAAVFALPAWLLIRRAPIKSNF